MQNHKPDVVKDKEIVDKNYLIFGDCNANEIRTELLTKRYNTNKQMVFWLYFDDVMAYCDKAILKKKPANVMLHCGYNDVDKHKNNPLKVVNSIDQTLKKIKEKFPENIIIMSTLD